MRHITSHMCQGDPNAKAVIVQAEEELGPGGAPHYYRVRCINMDGSTHINFQNGPINEVGPNGITMEALLAVVKDRLEHFQAGPYPCEENAYALDAVNDALAALHQRTAKRLVRGVEGLTAT